MKVFSIEYKLVTSINGIEYKVVTSIILHLKYEWSTIVVLQSRHTRGGGINIIYSIASIMVYQSVCGKKILYPGLDSFLLYLHPFLTSSLFTNK